MSSARRPPRLSAKREPKSSPVRGCPHRRLRAGRRWARRLSARWSRRSRPLPPYRRRAPAPTTSRCSAHVMRESISVGAPMTWRTPLACTIILVVYLACALLAHRGDMRTLYTRAPPRWWLASPVRFPLVKELVLYTRIYTSVLRVWYVAPGYTVYTRLQMLHCLATNLVTNAAGVLLFLGSDQCTKEQTLLAGFASAIASSILTLASRLTFGGYQRGELAAALHEHKIERYHRQMYRYVEEAINGGANESFDGASWWRGVKRRLRRRGRGRHAPPRAAPRARGRSRRWTRSSSTAPSTATRRRRGRPPPSSPRARGSPRVSPVVDRRSKNSRDSRLSRGSKSSSGRAPSLRWCQVERMPPLRRPRQLHRRCLGERWRRQHPGAPTEAAAAPPQHREWPAHGAREPADERRAAEGSDRDHAAGLAEAGAGVPAARREGGERWHRAEPHGVERDASLLRVRGRRGERRRYRGQGTRLLRARLDAALAQVGGEWFDEGARVWAEPLGRTSTGSRGARGPRSRSHRRGGAPQRHHHRRAATDFTGGAERPSDSAAPRRGRGAGAAHCRRRGSCDGRGARRRSTVAANLQGRAADGVAAARAAAPAAKGVRPRPRCCCRRSAPPRPRRVGSRRNPGGTARPVAAFVPVVHVAAAPSQERVKFANRLRRRRLRMVRATYVAADLPRGVSADGVRYSQTLTAAQRDEHALANRDANSPQKGRRIPSLRRRSGGRAASSGARWTKGSSAGRGRRSQRRSSATSRGGSPLCGRSTSPFSSPRSSSSSSSSSRARAPARPSGSPSNTRPVREMSRGGGTRGVARRGRRGASRSSTRSYCRTAPRSSSSPSSRRSSYRRSCRPNARAGARVLRLFVRMFFNALEVIA